MRRMAGRAAAGAQRGGADHGAGRAPLLIAIAAGLALVVGVWFLTQARGSGSPGGTDAGGTPTGDCIALAVTASSEKAALLRDLAADYSKQAKVDGRCVTATVTSKASGGATTALAKGWDETVDGPRPDVWTPASSSWVVLLRQKLSQADKPDLVPTGELPSLAQTPLVVAMPRPMAEALGWPGTPIGWTDLLALAKDPKGWGGKGHPEWGTFRLGKTNPEFSTSGLNATIATYFAATGRSSDLSLKDVADPKVTAFVKGIEQSVVHYGDTTLTFLGNQYKADQQGRGLSYVSAVTVEEKSVWDFNQGNPSGDPKTLGKQVKPKTPLVAVYPREGTLLSDNPWVVLKADWVDATKQAAAADFLDYVQRPESQKRFTDAAFRTYEGKPGPLATQANGMIPGQPTTIIDPPPPAVLQAVSDSWQELRKRARVLMVLDTSGSMGADVPDAGATKLDLAKQAVSESLGLMAPNDELGLWTFSTGQGEPDAQGRVAPWRQAVPVGPVKANLAPIRGAIDGLVADGGTGLYATLRAAQQAMLKDLDPSKINAIVLLTDGKNEYPADTDLDGLLRQLQGESVDTTVRVFPIAYGADADLATLRKIAEASSGAAYDAKDPASLQKVLVSVISNF